MSVYGGDSWAREAQQRKRRVDHLMLQHCDDSNYKNLSNGKYACLICPNHPILDTPLMLSMHSRGTRHIAAESKLKERELAKQEEIKKRTALSANSTHDVAVCFPDRHFWLSSKPLIERTRKALHNQIPEVNDGNGSRDVKLKGNTSFFNANPQSTSKEGLEPSVSVKTEPCSPRKNNNPLLPGEANKMMFAEQQAEFQRRREKELKFIAAGWKRNCHGRWFQDENVEFDSDEEDPNASLP